MLKENKRNRSGFYCGWTKGGCVRRRHAFTQARSPRGRGSHEVMVPGNPWESRPRGEGRRCELEVEFGCAQSAGHFQPDLMAGQQLHEGFRRLSLGEQHVDLVERAEAGHGVAAELARIRRQVDLSRVV